MGLRGCMTCASAAPIDPVQSSAPTARPTATTIRAPRTRVSRLPLRATLCPSIYILITFYCQYRAGVALVAGCADGADVTAASAVDETATAAATETAAMAMPIGVSRASGSRSSPRFEACASPSTVRSERAGGWRPIPNWRCGWSWGLNSIHRPRLIDLRQHHRRPLRLPADKAYAHDSTHAMRPSLDDVAEALASLDQSRDAELTVEVMPAWPHSGLSGATTGLSHQAIKTPRKRSAGRPRPRGGQDRSEELCRGERERDLRLPRLPPWSRQPHQCTFGQSTGLVAANKP